MSDHLSVTHSLSDDTKQFIQSLAVAYQHNTGTKLSKIMAQIDDLNSAIADLKTAADAAKVRDQAIIDALTALQNNPPSGPDLTAAIQNIKDPVSEEGTVGNLPPVPAPAA